MKQLWNALQPREKKMLYVLLVFLLLMGGWFVALKPVLETYTKQKNTLASKQTELMSLREDLTRYQNAPSQLKVQKKKYKSLVKSYYPVLKHEQISKMITDQCVKAGMTPTDLKISNSTTEGLDNSSENNSSTNNSSSDSSSNNSSSASKSTTDDRLKTVYVDVSLNGNLKSVIKLFKNVEGSMKHVGITSLAYETQDTDSSTESKEDTFTVQFAFYMIKK